MNSGLLLALSLFVSGVVALLIWIALMLGNPRLGPILRKAVVFFLLPGAVIVVIPIVAPQLLLWPLMRFGIWAIVGLLLLLVLVEELLKLAASRSEARLHDKFAFAMLFGIAELMLSKPLTPLIAGELMGDWGRWGVAGLTLGALLALLMHSVTAAFYAFQFPRSPWLGLLTCFVLHAVYNFLVMAYLSVTLVVVLAIILGFVLIGLLQYRQSEQAPAEAD